MKSENFPHLKQIIHISHKTIPGAEKFKHCMNYTRPALTNVTLPEVSSNTNAFEIHSEGKTVTITHGEALDKVESFTKEFNMDYSNVVNSAPIIYPVNLSLGLLGSINNRNYSVFPGTYKFIDSLKLIESQKAELFICEENMLEVNPAKDKINEIKDITKSVKNVVVFSNAKSAKKADAFAELFANAKFHYYDDLTFNKL